MKKFIKSKTLLFAYLLAILGVIETQIHLIKENLAEHYGIVTIVISCLVAVLRVVTTKPLRDYDK